MVAMPTAIAGHGSHRPAPFGETFAELREQNRTHDVVGLKVVIEEESGGHGAFLRRLLSTRTFAEFVPLDPNLEFVFSEKMAEEVTGEAIKKPARIP